MTRTSAAVIAIEDILPSPQNIRRSRLTNLEPLAASIRSVGVLQTCLVRPAPDGKYALVEGHRRRAAALLAGKTHLPCMIRSEDRTDETILMTVANLQREGLDPIDAAKAFSDLRERMPTAEIARLTGISAATINARIGLLLLPEEAQRMVSGGHLSLGDAADLVKSVKQRRTGTARVGTRRRTSAHFTKKHPLADHVRTRCTHRESDRRLIGDGCGECWEATIRADALGLLDNVTPLTAESA